MKRYEGPVVLPHDFRAACALVDELREQYQKAADVHFAVACKIGADPAIIPLRDARDIARDKFERHAAVLARLRP